MSTTGVAFRTQRARPLGTWVREQELRPEAEGQVVSPTESHAGKLEYGGATIL